MKDNNSKQIILSVLGIAILIVAVVGISYAIFTTTLAGTKENTLTTGTISMTYNEATNGILITNAMPMTDTDGKALTGTNNVFDFTVNATIAGVTTVTYEVAAQKVAVAENGLADTDVKLYLEKKSGETYSSVFAPANYVGTSAVDAYGAPAGIMVLATGTFANTTATENTYSDAYRLRMWVASTTNVSGTAKTYQVKVNVYGKV